MFCLVTVVEFCLCWPSSRRENREMLPPSYQFSKSTGPKTHCNLRWFVAMRRGYHLIRSNLLGVLGLLLDCCLTILYIKETMACNGVYKISQVDCDDCIPRPGLVMILLRYVLLNLRRWGFWESYAVFSTSRCCCGNSPRIPETGWA